MNYGSHLVNTIAFLTICAAIVIVPLCSPWLVAGMIADKMDRRRYANRRTQS